MAGGPARAIAGAHLSRYYTVATRATGERRSSGATCNLPATTSMFASPSRSRQYRRCHALGRAIAVSATCRLWRAGRRRPELSAEQARDHGDRDPLTVDPPEGQHMDGQLPSTANGWYRPRANSWGCSARRASAWRSTASLPPTDGPPARQGHETWMRSRPGDGCRGRRGSGPELGALIDVRDPGRGQLHQELPRLLARPAGSIRRTKSATDERNSVPAAI